LTLPPWVSVLPEPTACWAPGDPVIVAVTGPGAAAGVVGELVSTAVDAGD
jgi:hypothetical protein